MRVAGFMSGSGTNLVKIIERERSLGADTPFRVNVVVTDNKYGNAEAIADRFALPLVTHDIMDFYARHGRPDKKDLSLRPRFDEELVGLLEAHDADVVALAGYMSIVTLPLLERFPGRMINVHPADLCVARGGHRRYTGARAVDVAIAAGETSLRSSVHIVREQVDYGEVLARSAPLPVELPPDWTAEALARPENRAELRRVAGTHQDRLKERGDWIVFPRTLEWLARGRFGFDAAGGLRFDGAPAPRGVELDENGAVVVTAMKED